MDFRTPLLLPSLLVMATAPLDVVLAQQLRLGVTRADHVVIARQVGLQPLGKGLVLHRFETLEVLHGAALTTFSIPIATQVADQPTPAPTATRLCCLRRRSHQGDLPERYAPYFDLTGYRGDHVQLTDPDATRSVMDLVRVLLRAEAGERPREIAGDLLRIALEGRGPAQLEASETLRDRAVLRGDLNRLQLESLLTRAMAETADVPLKISLASLCIEAGAADGIPALLMALRDCHDPRYALAVGRLARFVHDETAEAALLPFVSSARGATRGAALLALGATGTDGALAKLIELRERCEAQSEDRRAIDAALRAHGSKAALDIVEGTEPAPAEQRRGA